VKSPSIPTTTRLWPPLRASVRGELVEQLPLPLAGFFFECQAEVCEGCGGDHPSPRGPLHKPDPQQKRLNLVLDRLGDNVHAVCDRLHPGRSASENRHQDLQVLAVEAVESQDVDLEHPQRLVGQRIGDLRMPSGVGEVAGPAEQVVGLTGYAPAAH